jgi:hypothetical protein
VDVTKPWPLNSDGTKKANPTDTIEYLTFQPYAKSAWAGVPLS